MTKCKNKYGIYYEILLRNAASALLNDKSSGSRRGFDADDDGCIGRVCLSILTVTVVDDELAARRATLFTAGREECSRRILDQS